MALVPGNLVHQTSSTTGTGAQTLMAVSGKRTFNTEHGTGGTDVFDYFISSGTQAEWERGTGHLSSATVLVRDTVLQSSNSDALVNFSTGVKNITNDLPSSEQAGVWDLLETVVASSDATINITGLTSTYFTYKFIWVALVPSTNAVTFQARTSTDAGVSYDAGETDYAYTNHHLTMVTSPGHASIGDDLASALDLTLAFQIGTAFDELSDLEITLFNPSDTNFTKFTWDQVGIDQLATGVSNVGAGMRLSAANVDSVRFLMSSGNIAEGTLKVYGQRA